MIENIIKTPDLTSIQKKYILYEITYSDGSSIELKQLLQAKTQKTIKVRVAYKTDLTVNDLPAKEETLNLAFQVIFVQADNSAINKPPIIDGKIPISGKFYRGVASKKLGSYDNPSMVLSQGDLFPSKLQDGDVFVYNGYEYRYNEFCGYNEWQKNSIKGWGVRVTSMKESHYGEILSEICNQPIVSLHSTFCDCINLIIAPQAPESVTDMYCTYTGCINIVNTPKIPAGVTNIEGIFNNCHNITETPILPENITSLFCSFESCEKLKKAPNIPKKVNNMENAFLNCISLENAPNIPNVVTNMNRTFENCTSLRGEITINNELIKYKNIFYNTAKDVNHTIILKGTNTNLNELKKTGYNNGQFIVIE